MLIQGDLGVVLRKLRSYSINFVGSYDALSLSNTGSREESLGSIGYRAS